MRQYEILMEILKARVVGIIRTDTECQAYEASLACIRGGMKALEVTFTVPNAKAVIEKLANDFDRGDVIIGAGTVLDSETARIAILSGAQFIVSPNFDPAIAALCNLYSTVYLPGVMTVNEIITALKSGVAMVKVFPAGVLGMPFIKAVKAPIPHILLMPTGGVSLDNAEAWLKNGADALGIGGQLTKGVEDGDYKRVEQTAKAFCDLVCRL